MHRVLARHAVTVRGAGTAPLLFVHGYGCDQQTWRHIAPQFEDGYKVVTYDLMGSGRSRLSGYDKTRYATLHTHADDLIAVCDRLDLRAIQVMAHSAGGMIALLAAKKRPDLFSHLMLLGASPCYTNSDGYTGGFSAGDIDELLAFLAINHAGWAAQMAPLVMANPDRPELSVELEGLFVRNAPDILHHFAHVIFRSDYRADIAGIQTPCLVMQCQDDVVVPFEVGLFLNHALSASELVILDTHGHYPQLSSPGVVVEAMRCWLDRHREPERRRA